MGGYEQSKPFSFVLWLRMIQAVFTVSSAATGLRICLNHTVCLKNVLDCASRHKPHYVSVKCEVSRGDGSVPGWCVFPCVCACVWVWVFKKKNLVWIVLLRIWTHSAINYYTLMQWLRAEESWGAVMERVTERIDLQYECKWLLIKTSWRSLKYGISEAFINTQITPKYSGVLLFNSTESINYGVFLNFF